MVPLYGQRHCTSYGALSDCCIWAEADLSFLGIRLHAHRIMSCVVAGAYVTVNVRRLRIECTCTSHSIMRMRCRYKHVHTRRGMRR